MIAATTTPGAPAAERGEGADKPKRKGWRPSGLLLFVIFVAVFMVTEIAFFVVAHMLPDDYIGDQPRVQAPEEAPAAER